MLPSRCGTSHVSNDDQHGEHVSPQSEALRNLEKTSSINFGHLLLKPVYFSCTHFSRILLLFADC